ncbi:MAG: leucine-rich repeat protein [Ruminococcus sp.]|nr:leucine-rich repeat protein [Ruminococcus sp.]
MKFYKIITTLFLLANLNPVLSYSENISKKINFNGMNFILTDNSAGELILTGYTGSEENLVVPECIGDYTVTAIDNKVFKNNQKIKNVILPDTINYFGFDVFRNSSLVSVNIPKNLKIIPDYSFNNCSELETVIFHDDIAVISNTAFTKTDISVPPELYDRVTDKSIEDSETECFFQGEEWDYTIISENGEIKSHIEQYNGNSTDITIPDTLNSAEVTEISSTAFDEVSTIKSIFFPETITELNISFAESALEEITLPDIDNIPDSEFMNCKNLKKITFQGYQKSFSIGANAFKNCVNIDFIPYPENCTNINIGNSAFENTGIAEIKIEFTSSIGTDAFRDCEDLLYIELNNTYVSSRAFRGCTLLENAVINGNSVLEESSFYDCYALENITLSDLNISMINAVYNCPDFMNINNQNVFDSETGDFNKEFKEFIFENFSGVDNVGFINLYVQAQAEKIINENISDNMTDFQKVKIIHDWICRNTVYDSGLSGDRKNHNDASVLMNDSTVCEGYARIANILYNTAGIESCYVSGIGHAWNIVKIGSNYFHIDTTWDDGEEISYEWFMKSDDEIKKSDGNHAEWKLYAPSPLHYFQKETLPVCKYSMGDLNQDGKINIADLVTMNKYILCQDNISYDTYILSDLTFDGIVDSFDLVKMKKLIIMQN